MREWIGNRKFRTKLIVVFIIVCFLPLGIIFLILYNDLVNAAMDNQLNMLNQNYEQICGSLEDELERMRQISLMIAVNEDINQTFRTVEDMTVYEQLESFTEIANYTATLLESSAMDNIVYYTEKESAVTGYGAVYYRALDSIREEPYYRRFLEGNSKVMWMAYTDLQTPLRARYLTLCRAIWNFEDLRQALGVMLISIDKKELDKMLENEDQYMVLLDSDNQIVYANRTGNELESLREIRIEELDLGLGDYQRTAFRQQPYLYRAQRIRGTNLIFFSAISQKTVSLANSERARNAILLWAVVGTLLLLIILRTSDSLTRRIRLLSEKMNGIQDGALEVLEIAPCDDEVGRLVKSYNYMISKLQCLMRKERKIGQEKKDAELRALQAQINPHFLYNTLDMIGWMSARNENDNVQHMLQVLSRYYRLVLGKGKDIVPLSHEIEMCSAYMDIQLKRFKGKIQYETEIAPEALEAALPKITLQPLLENAIVHGINQKPGGRGKISVRAWSKGGRLMIQVSDDGMGFGYDKTKPGSGSSYGMKNIEMRLNIFFGQEKSLSVESVPGFGTDIFIDVPIVPQREAGMEEEGKAPGSA